ncbi:hypothetical protein KIW84_054860 [Lathyrus oleraceus]|uniref:DUF7745 domain-containing protein n=1 Tax=Pisum sativum TaxID=3888 RepID=A0A9D4WWJ9_PEA|nr:hypothetical protein KIW84_054860 [Pisum sativum]
MEYGKRKTLQFKIREPKIDNLRNYAMSLSKDAFSFKISNWLRPLKSGKILEISKPTKGPFKMIGYRPTVEEMAYHLSIHEVNLQANLRVCGDFKGFPREYLEKKAGDFATSVQWDSIDNIMTLLTFRLILVPTERDFVDYTTINLFLAVKIGDEDPVPALLAFCPSKWSESYE